MQGHPATKQLQLKLITFDAFNTLFRVKHSVGSVYLNSLQTHIHGTHQHKTIYNQSHESTYISNKSHKILQHVTPHPNTITAHFLQAYKRTNRIYPIFGRYSIGYRKWWDIVVHETLLSSYDDQHPIATTTSSKSVNKYKEEEDGIQLLDPHLLSLISNDLFHVFSGSEPFEVLSNVKTRLDKVTCRRRISSLARPTPDRANSQRDSSTGGSETIVITGIISNSDPRTHGVLASLDLAQYFDFVVLSYEEGVEKPDRRIFDIAEEKARQVIVDRGYHTAPFRRIDGSDGGRGGFMNLMHMERLHVGDSEVLDLEAARRAGWQSMSGQAFFDVKSE